MPQRHLGTQGGCCGSCSRRSLGVGNPQWRPLPVDCSALLVREDVYTSYHRNGYGKMLPFEAPRRIVLDERLCLAATPSVGYLACFQRSSPTISWSYSTLVTFSLLCSWLCRAQYRCGSDMCGSRLVPDKARLGLEAHSSARLLRTYLLIWDTSSICLHFFWFMASSRFVYPGDGLVSCVGPSYG